MKHRLIEKEKAINNSSMMRWASLARYYYAPGRVLSIQFYFYKTLFWTVTWPKAALSGLSGGRQQSADRWFLSMAVNRPLVGELTPVTLLVFNSRLPSHSLGQLKNFSQKSDEQVVAAHMGSGRTCLPQNIVPISVNGCVGENLAYERKTAK